MLIIVRVIFSKLQGTNIKWNELYNIHIDAVVPKFPEYNNSRDRPDRYANDFMQIAGHQTSVVKEKEGEKRGAVNAFFLTEKSVTRPKWNTRGLTRPSLSHLTLNATLTSPAGKLFRKRRRFTWSAAASEL